MEQTKNIIFADSNSLGNTNAIVSAWRGSSQVFWVSSVEPFVKLWFKIGDFNGKYYAGIPAVFHTQKNLWRVYVAPAYFQTAGETHYKIIAQDAQNNRRVCGDGVLRVHSGAIADVNDWDNIIGKCAVVQDINDETKFYRVSASVDAAGQLAFVLTPTTEIGAAWTADTGVNPTATRVFTGEEYAFNPVTGFYYQIFERIDDNGNPMLFADDTPVMGDECFALNEGTGFYHRIEINNEGLALNNTGVRK